MNTKYQAVPLAQVMQFYADAFEGELERNPFGHVDADWWIDTEKGSVIFRVTEREVARK